MYKHLLLLTSICLVVGCTRHDLAPLEVKIEDGFSGSSVSRSPVIKDTYTVKAGDTIPSIASALDIDPSSLASWNGLSISAKLTPGQVLKLPSGSANHPENIASAAGAGVPSYSSVQLAESNGDQAKVAQKSDELDNRLSKMLDDNPAKKSEEKKSKSNGRDTVVLKGGSSFNEQEAALSSPKITHTASGEAVGAEKKVVATSASGKLPMPTNGKVISKFGDMLDGMPNDGINIKAPAGTPVTAVSNGEVIYAGNKLDESFGNVVIVKHNDGLISSYANMQDIAKGMRQGTKIKAGQQVGTVGKTGDVTSPQLHFEIMKDNTPLNPAKYLNM